MTSTVFARAATKSAEDDFLGDFKIVKGIGTLHGLTNRKYVIVGEMVYAEGDCPENNQTVGGYKSRQPDDGRNLRELGFVWNADLDVPAVEVRGRVPK